MKRIDRSLTFLGRERLDVVNLHNFRAKALKTVSHPDTTNHACGAQCREARCAGRSTSLDHFVCRNGTVTLPELINHFLGWQCDSDLLQSASGKQRAAVVRNAFCNGAHVLVDEGDQAVSSSKGREVEYELSFRVLVTQKVPLERCVKVLVVSEQWASEIAAEVLSIDDYVDGIPITAAESEV